MMTVEEKAAVLARGVFAELPEGLLKAIAERTGEQRFPAGETLFLQGQPGTEVFFIVSGQVEIIRDGTVVALAEPGELIGEMAVLGEGRRTAGGKAKGEVRLLFLKGKALRYFVHKMPDLAFTIFKVLIERLAKADELIAFMSAERRELGTVEVVSPAAAQVCLPIYHREAVLGHSRGSAVADGLRLAIETDDQELLERHATVTVEDDTVFIEPLEGQVFVNDQQVENRLALGPNETVRIGGLQLRFAVSRAEQ